MKRSPPRFVPILLLSLAVAAGLRADWRADADARIERLRKGDFSLTVLDAAGQPVPGARLEYQLKRHAFLFGMAIAYRPFADPGPDGEAYRQFILDHFSGLVCENEMKWYANEPDRGDEEYGEADALLAFAEDHGLQMRGHNLLWAKPKYAMPWLRALDPTALRAAVDHRLQSIVLRYRGRVVSWDVNNEMLDGSFYRDRLGAAIVPWVFAEAHRLDPRPALFVNEYGILGNPEKTERLIALVRSLRAAGAPVGGIGIQAHDTARFVAQAHDLGPMDRPEIQLNSPLTPEIFLHTIDRIHAATGLPIHLTEISAKTPDAVARGQALETLFRLGFSHPAVQAIVLWGFGAKTHWMGPQAALMDADNTLNPAGRRIAHLLSEEWTTRGQALTSPTGSTRLRGFYGLYSVEIVLPDGQRFTREVSLTQSVSSATIDLPPGA